MTWVEGARGFGFVEMSADDDAHKAINQLNEYQLSGRGLAVNEARPKASSGFSGASGGKRRRREPRW